MYSALRISLVVLLTTAAPLALADQCETKERAQQSLESFKQTVKTLKEKHDARKAELEAEIKSLMQKMVDSKRWTPAQRDGFFKEQRDSLAAQEEIKILNKRASGAFSAMMKAGTIMEENYRKGDFITACRQIRPSLEGATTFAEISERDLVYRLNLVKKAAAK